MIIRQIERKSEKNKESSLNIFSRFLAFPLGSPQVSRRFSESALLLTVSLDSGVTVYTYYGSLCSRSQRVPNPCMSATGPLPDLFEVHIRILYRPYKDLIRPFL